MINTPENGSEGEDESQTGMNSAPRSPVFAPSSSPGMSQSNDEEKEDGDDGDDGDDFDDILDGVEEKNAEPGMPISN